MKHTMLYMKLNSAVSVFAVAAAFSVLLPPSPALAGVCFLPDCAESGILDGNHNMDINSDSKFCEDNSYVSSCPENTAKIPDSECYRDASYFKCSETQWCKDNGYSTTSCSVPQYPSEQCPNGEPLYKSCKTDNAKACKELGYTNTCPSGQKLKKDSGRCSYDSSYGTCCTPSGCPNYTSLTSSSYGTNGTDGCEYTCYYTCNMNCPSGTSTSNPEGCGGSTKNGCGNVTCYYPYQSCCSSSYKYDTTNCNGTLSGSECGGKYNKCYQCGTNIGDFYCRGGTAVGIVIANGLAVSLDEKYMQNWGPNNDTSAPNYNYSISSDNDGKGNTAAEVSSLGSSTSHAPGYCYNYKTTGTSAGEWFLPAYSQLRTLYNNKNTINASLSALNQTSLGSRVYWTSSEGKVSLNCPYRAWAMYFGNGDHYDLCKTKENEEPWYTGQGYIRCMISF